jgi:hypothetical protein
MTENTGPFSLAINCDVCMAIVLSLRRHDPDQVLRVFLSPYGHPSECG